MSEEDEEDYGDEEYGEEEPDGGFVEEDNLDPEIRR